MVVAAAGGDAGGRKAPLSDPTSSPLKGSVVDEITPPGGNCDPAEVLAASIANSASNSSCSLAVIVSNEDASGGTCGPAPVIVSRFARSASRSSCLKSDRSDECLVGGVAGGMAAAALPLSCGTGTTATETALGEVFPVAEPSEANTIVPWLDGGVAVEAVGGSTTSLGLVGAAVEGNAALFVVAVVVVVC